MKVGVPKERREGEPRVAVSPDSIKKLIQLGFDVDHLRIFAREDGKSL